MILPPVDFSIPRGALDFTAIHVVVILLFDDFYFLRGARHQLHVVALELHQIVQHVLLFF